LVLTVIIELFPMRYLKALIILLFSVLLLSNVTATDTRKLDSLQQQLSKSGGLNKIALLNGLSKACLPDQPTAAINYARSALKLANKFKNENLLAESYLNLGAGYYNRYAFDSAIYFYNKSAFYFRKNKKFSELAGVLNNTALIRKDMAQFDDALSLHSKAILYYRSVNDFQGEATTLNFIGNVYLKQGKYDLAVRTYDASLSIRKKHGNILDIVNSLDNLGIVFRDYGNCDKAIAYLNEALRRSELLGDFHLIGNTLHLLGSVYTRKKDYVQAVGYYLRSLRIRTSIGDEGDIASSMQNIGLLYKELGNYRKSLEYFKEASLLYEKQGDKKKLASIYNLIGSGYSSSNDNTNALFYYLKSLKIREELGDRKELVNISINLANAYMGLKNGAEAFKVLKKSMDIAQSLHDDHLIVRTFNELGNYYLWSGNHRAMFLCFNRTVALADSISDLFNAGLASRKLAEFYLSQHDYAKAIDLGNYSLSLGQKLSNTELQRKAYFVLYNAYDARHDYQKALNLFRNYAALNETSLEKTNTANIIEKELNFKVERKEEEINKIEEEKQHQERIHELKVNNFRSFTAITIILVLLGAFFAYREYLNKKKTNEILQEKYDYTQRTNKILQESEENLRKVVSTKDKFFSIMAHDIKNPLGGLMGLTELMAEDQNSMTEEEKKESIMLIHSTSKNLYGLLENLLQWSRSQTGKIKYNPEHFDLANMVTNIQDLFRLNAEKKNIIINAQIKKGSNVYADKEMVSTILRNLVSNAIKFSYPGTEIQILIEDKPVEFLISVKDQGMGIDSANINKLFRIDVHYSTAGTMQEGGTGLGLILCKEFVEKNGGQLSVDSRLGEGSTFNFTLPKG
jgi:two-component system, sensor histidine kinase and response regulator